MSLDQLKASLRGELIQQGDAKYADAIKVHNGMIHKNPKYPKNTINITSFNS